MKYTFNIVTSQNICELTCFKLDMMLNSTKLHSLNDVDVHSRSQGYRKPRTCAVNCVVTLRAATGTFLMVDYVREMTEEVL